MQHGMRLRRDECRDCGRDAAGEGDRCIFCGASLLVEHVTGWRSVYHPYSYADALLANATLQAHGLTARVKQGGLDRVLVGHAGVVEVAEGEHLFAQEVLRQLRGVRTDTEYREWQELKQQRRRRGIMLRAFAAATATAAVAGIIAWGVQDERRTASPAQRSAPAARE